MAKVLYWTGMTALQPFNTGVQRVTRCLGKALQDNGVEIIPVKWNFETNEVTSLNGAECENLARWSGPQCSPIGRLPETKWLILPEITIPIVPPSKGVIPWAKSVGLKTAAIFYDLIPLHTRHLYRPHTMLTLNHYWRSLSKSDVIIPISQTVTEDLEKWLKYQLLYGDAQISPCLISGELPEVPRETIVRMPPTDTLKLFSVGTWEPRKNFPMSLRAVKKARAQSGRDIRITIVGRHAREEFPQLHDEIYSIAESMGEGVVDLRSSVSDEEMSDLTRSSHMTVFGSVWEGFGLPVIESLWQGKPAICHNGSALAEVAPGGGTVMVDMHTEDGLADAIVWLANNPDELLKLYQEAVSRPLKTWNDYAREIISIIPDIADVTEPTPNRAFWGLF